MKVVLLLFTLVNIALTCLGAMTAMMSPMMFDSGGTDDNLKWAIFWNILFFPVVALACVFLPWLFVWLKWLRAALVASTIPTTYAVIIFALMSVLDAMRPKQTCPEPWRTTTCDRAGSTSNRTTGARLPRSSPACAFSCHRSRWRKPMSHPAVAR